MTSTREYERIAAAICFIAANYHTQPSLEQVAAHTGLSAYHFQRLFTRWAGISPKRFIGCLTADHARRLLRESHTVLDTALEVGLSGPGRLHDLLITYEAMTPGEFKALGSGVEIRWGFHPSPFGACLVLQTARGICGVAFADPGRETEVQADMFARWRGARFVEDPAVAARLVPRVLEWIT